MSRIPFQSDLGGDILETWIQSSGVRTDLGEETVDNNAQGGRHHSQGLSAADLGLSTEKAEWDGGGMEEKQKSNVEDGVWPGAWTGRMQSACSPNILEAEARGP